MFIDSKMMQTNYLLEHSLDVESLRRKVISNNIANVDVPHFRRSEVNFESELRRAVQQNEEARENALPTLTSDERHIPFYLRRNIRGVNPRVNLDFVTRMRNDGSNVDIEKEMVDGAKNMMRYNTFVSSINHNYKMLNIAMKQI